jgi:AraC family transcriptional regulator of adaptative response/methylated-DNA-[protein]-cysteine methyltransferase
MASDRGLAGLAFADPGEEAAALTDMRSRWPKAVCVENATYTGALAKRIFDPEFWRADRPLRVVLIGTDFEVRVWETLLKIPMGRTVTYSDVAVKVGAGSAARAVGAAVGKNPVSFVVPCHRVLGQRRRHYGLPLGAHPQTGNAGVGGGKDRKLRCIAKPAGSKSHQQSHC